MARSTLFLWTPTSDNKLDCLVLDVQPTTYLPELVMICFDLAEYTT